MIDNRLPSRQLADYLEGHDKEPAEAILSWSAFYIYDAAKQVLSLPKDNRRAAIDKLPVHIRPLVETEIKRLWKLR